MLSKILLIALGLVASTVSANSAAITYYGSDEDGVTVGSRDNKLVKFVSVAIPTNFPNLRFGEWVTIPVFQGRVLPGMNKAHSGCFRVDDECPTSLCRNHGQHFDIFVGNFNQKRAAMERIIDSNQWTTYYKGCSGSARVATEAIEVESYQQAEVEVEDSFEEIFDDADDIFDDEVVVRTNSHGRHHHNDDFLN